LRLIIGKAKPKDLIYRLIKFHSANIQYFNLHALSRKQIKASNLTPTIVDAFHSTWFVAFNAELTVLPFSFVDIATRAAGQVRRVMTCSL